MYVNVLRRVVDNSQKLEIIQIPKIRGKDKQSVVYPQRGVLLSIKKKKKIKERLTTDATQVVDLKLLSNPLREGSQTQMYMCGKVPFI